MAKKKAPKATNGKGAPRAWPWESDETRSELLRQIDAQAARWAAVEASAVDPVRRTEAVRISRVLQTLALTARAGDESTQKRLEDVARPYLRKGLELRRSGRRRERDLVKTRTEAVDELLELLAGCLRDGVDVATDPHRIALLVVTEVLERGELAALLRAKGQDRFDDTSELQGKMAKAFHRLALDRVRDPERWLLAGLSALGFPKSDRDRLTSYLKRRG